TAWRSTGSTGSPASRGAIDEHGDDLRSAGRLAPGIDAPRRGRPAVRARRKASRVATRPGPRNGRAGAPGRRSLELRPPSRFRRLGLVVSLHVPLPAERSGDGSVPALRRPGDAGPRVVERRADSRERQHVPVERGGRDAVAVRGERRPDLLPGAHPGPRDADGAAALEESPRRPAAAAVDPNDAPRAHAGMVSARRPRRTLAAHLARDWTSGQPARRVPA